MAGSWQPEVIDEFGIIPISTSDAITIPVVISAVSPSVALNPYGGTNLVILGENLPPYLNSKTNASVVFADGTICDITKINETTISCTTETFTSAESDGMTLGVYVNG